MNQITIKADLMKYILNFRIECPQIFFLNSTLIIRFENNVFNGIKTGAV
jgi:hypothetical protein